jgi:N-methylhydantoinase A
MDLRYFGQSYELTVPTFKPLTREKLQQTIVSFHQKHMTIYGYEVRDEPVELVNIKLVAMGLVKKPKLKEQRLQGKEPLKGAMITRRKVFFEQCDDYLETPIYNRGRLKAGNVIEGPAVIEQYDATTVVYPDWKASVDRFGNIVLLMKEGD